MCLIGKKINTFYVMAKEGQSQKGSNSRRKLGFSHSLVKKFSHWLGQVRPDLELLGNVRPPIVQVGKQVISNW